MAGFAAAQGQATVGSKELLELIHAKTSLTQDRAQCATVDLAVIRNDGLCEWLVAAHDDVATVLPPD